MEDADVGVIVLKPVLVLTACASEYFKGDGLDDISQLAPSCFHGGVIIWSMHVLQFLVYLLAEIKKRSLTLWPASGLNSEPHLGENEAVIRPTIGIADRLGHQHGPSILPPDENIVQQLPAPRPLMHPRGLLPRQKAEVGVGLQETVFRTRVQKKEAVNVTATEIVGTSTPCQIAYSVPTGALKSPRPFNLSAFGTAGRSFQCF
ncbi:unnamed protein product [Schistocephalus solidus]|uniref:Uncharacterized protein n=1 Tax=Schistocephalus solidus TaxID=70667 RepID=A0A183TPN3_SCHSO|nr:unnamed protein product [Schistocephalus solidus]